MVTNRTIHMSPSQGKTTHERLACHGQSTWRAKGTFSIAHRESVESNNGTEGRHAETEHRRSLVAGSAWRGLFADGVHVLGERARGTLYACEKGSAMTHRKRCSAAVGSRSEVTTKRKVAMQKLSTDGRLWLDRPAGDCSLMSSMSWASALEARSMPVKKGVL